MSVKLRGVTWNHSRGYTSIVGVTQRYAETHPGFDVVWCKRSLQDFESEPIDKLANEYDLLIIDHPWAGYAVEHGVLLPLNKLLPADYLADQRTNSIGASFASYDFNGFQSALAIDAASPVSVWRPDLISSSDLPRSFEEAVSLAGHHRVVYAATPIYLLMDFYALCNTAGGRLFDESDRDHVVDKETGVRVLEDMRMIASRCPDIIFDLDTIQLHELLAHSDTLSYCPAVYGYVNYSRRGYAKHRLKAGSSIRYMGRTVRGVLGGTGLAISAATDYPQEAAAFAMYVASDGVQRTLYADTGGQPAYRSAWLDVENNRATLDFFADTLTTLDLSYIRPRYSGYLTFQNHAGTCIQEYVRHGGDPRAVIDKLDGLYVASRRYGKER